MADPQPRRGFSTPPEVTSFFEDKGLRPAFSWQDVWGEEHAYAFTVAKATELELLTAFKASIAEALRNGQGFETWRTGLMPVLQRLGWAEPRTVTDPKGEMPPREVNFASPRRLRTIFWSNMHAARSAGQWDRAQRTKAALPYVLYVRTTSSDPRREHLGWVGTILPVDDPWWSTHWPPNGWGCKCSVRQVTGRERDSLLGQEPKPGGIAYRDAPPDDGPPRTFTNGRTGEVTEVPAGIDPGWGGNPGLQRVQTLVTRLTERLAEAGPDDARAALASVAASPLPRILAGLPQEVMMLVAVAPAAVIRDLGATTGIVEASNHALGDKGERFGTVQPALDDAHAVAGGAAGERTVLGKVGADIWRAVVRAVDGGRRLILGAFNRL